MAARPARLARAAARPTSLGQSTRPAFCQARREAQPEASPRGLPRKLAKNPHPRVEVQLILCTLRPLNLKGIIPTINLKVMPFILMDIGPLGPPLLSPSPRFQVDPHLSVSAGAAAGGRVPGDGALEGAAEILPPRVRAERGRRPDGVRRGGEDHVSLAAAVQAMAYGPVRDRRHQHGHSESRRSRRGDAPGGTSLLYLLQLYPFPPIDVDSLDLAYGRAP